MTRRRALALCAGIAVGAVGIWAVGAGPLRGMLPPVANAGTGSGPSASPSSATLKTAKVERRTVELAEDLDGTLGYDGSRAVLGGLQGTLTWLPADGSIVTRGHRLYEVDGTRRAYLMYGTRPAWRAFDPGMSDGRDVRQLEANLRALHYGSKNMKVDGHWSGATTAAVKRWQKATGQLIDGTIDQGEVVFLASAIRITSQSTEPGAPVGPGGALLSGTSTARAVSISLPANRQSLVSVGAAVSVELPDGSTTPGHVSRIGRVASSSQDAAGQPTTPTIEVTIALDDPSKAGTLDQAPVTVHVVTKSHNDVLAVPVNALVALLEGGYAVEVQSADGSRHYVSVTLGLFQDGYVEVSGNGISEGDSVVVPA
ncbi:MAG TPA: peptidoglycan-binding protein [Candidatus Acidoferrum sp.]|nr:peptidoglycan-binding protein [Candidatus Acidoferrum sp.]